ncbi:MAG: hypothetical protein SW833_12595 [Cyanobacteriota bacterium]|nr:hypothetical protein [Cyanobacteriota bacterium]
MNTPSHYVLNLALLGTTVAPNANVAIALGAIVPDFPIFVFYFVAKVILHLPERQIWSQAYYQPFWQTGVALFHSIPLAAIALCLCLYGGWKPGAIFFGSAIFHSLLDLPVHNDDAHRHFFPFSNYRFISPFSYWDPNHYGRIVAAIELLLVLGVTPVVFALLKTWPSKILLITINVVYVVGYLRFYLA